MAYDYARPINVIAPELVSALAMAQADLVRPIVYFTSSTITTPEGNTGTKNLTITARRSSLAGTLNVPGNFVQGTAGAADFVGNVLPGNRVWTCNAGSDTATVDIAISGDTDVESDDTFGFQLQPGSGYRLGTPSSVTGTILNDDTPQSSSAFAMTQLASPARVYPRATTTGGGAGKGAGPIPVTLNVTQAGTIYARTRSTASGNAILQAAYLAVSNAPIANGPVNIPNVDARPEEFFLDLSPDGTTWTNGTTPVGMGALIGYGGQSLAGNLILRASGSDTLAGVDESPTDKGAVFFETWQRPVENANTTGTTPNGAGANVIIRLLAEKFGCRIGFVGHAISATSIDVWVPGGGAGWTGLSTAINATGNRLEAFIWLQGHSDSGKTGVQYRARLDALMTAIDGLIPGANFTRYITTIPNISVTQWGSPLEKYTVRNAGDRWARDNPRAVSVPFDDIDQVDGIHPNQAGSKRQGLHYVRAISAPGDRAFTSHTVSKSGAVLTLNLTLAPGATALTAVGDLASRVGVWRRGMATTTARLPISSIAIGSAANGIVPVTITLASDPGDVLLDIWFNPKNDPNQTGSTGVLLDNFSQETGITVGRQVTTIRPFMLKARRDLVLTNPAFGPGMFGLQAMSDGFAFNTDRLVPLSGVGSTLEFWVKYSNVGGNHIWVNSAGRYIGVNATRFISNAGGADGLVPVDQWVHIAWTFDGPQSYFHVNGVLGFTMGGPDQAYADEGFSLRAFTNNTNNSTSSTSMCQVAMFDQAMRSPASFTPPTAAYTGSEAHLLHLWPLNGTGDDIAAR